MPASSQPGSVVQKSAVEKDWTRPMPIIYNTILFMRYLLLIQPPTPHIKIHKALYVPNIHTLLRVFFAIGFVQLFTGIKQNKARKYVKQFSHLGKGPVRSKTKPLTKAFVRRLS